MTLYAAGPLEAVLAHLAPITLPEVAGAALLDRREDKFLLPGAVLPELLAALSGGYKVLTVGGERRSPYRTLYLDTPDFAFYAAQHNGRAKRHKVRFRAYARTGTTFLEVKRRLPGGRTVKTRAPVPAPRLPLCGAGGALLAGEGLGDTVLEPKLWVTYDRITLVSRELPERLTFDLGLSFGRPGGGQAEHLGSVVVAELKRALRRQPSPFAELMRALGFRAGEFSKYGVGCGALYPLKAGAFKRQRLEVGRVLGNGC